MASLENLHDLFVNELRDIFDAEQQLLKALPLMSQAATSPELKQGFVRNYSHFAAEGVYFPYQMAFCRSAHRRVASHERYVFKAYCAHKRFMALSCAGKGGFTAGVPRAYNYYFIFSHKFNIS
jgi:hypothetical protein